MSSDHPNHEAGSSASSSGEPGPAEAAVPPAFPAAGAADGEVCAAIIGGQAYTVLVQEDEDGERHFGVGAYVGD